MKRLLTLTAILESVLGAALFTIPSIVGSVLLGGPLNTPAGLILGRLAGAAILSLSFACWLVRNDDNGSARTIVTVMTVYNIAAAAILVYALVGLELYNFFIWIALIGHGILALWCLKLLRLKSQKV